MSNIRAICTTPWGRVGPTMAVRTIPIAQRLAEGRALIAAYGLHVRAEQRIRQDT